MVTGLGGIFLKAKDPKYLSRWYEDNLGIGFGSTVYFSFKWREAGKADTTAYTVFSFFRDDSDYFFPSTSEFMLNLRVNNLDDLRISLKNNGATVIDKVESYDYGRFGWALDPAGNKIELWEPVDKGFEDYNDPMILKGVTGLGGVFLKCPDPAGLMDWYSKQFGLFFSNATHVFRWRDINRNEEGQTALSFFPDLSAYFDPSQKSHMLNFRVENLDGMLADLRSSSCEVIDKTEDYDYGKFGWLIDPEGNKIELWQPK